MRSLTSNRLKTNFASLNRIFALWRLFWWDAGENKHTNPLTSLMYVGINVLRWLRIYSVILRLQNDLSIMVLLTWSLPLSPTITNSDRCFFWTPFSIKTLMRLSTFFNTILLRSPRVANFLSCMYTWKEYS